MSFPSTERELVARLVPESPILFARARYLLRALTPDAVGRFRVGETAAGCWSVVYGEDGWQSVWTPVDADAVTSDHATARAAIAHAVGGLLAAEGGTVNNEVLRLAGLVDVDKMANHSLSDTGRRLAAETDASSGTSYVSLADITGRRGYFVREPGPAPAEGPFVEAHTVWSMAVFTQLPDSAGEPAQTLPEGTLLDGYGGAEEVFLYRPGTPFNRRGLPEDESRYSRRVYQVRTPLRVYPAFPFEKATIAVDPPEDQGRGYYLVDEIAALLASGALSETTEHS